MQKCQVRVRGTVFPRGRNSQIGIKEGKVRKNQFGFTYDWNSWGLAKDRFSKNFPSKGDYLALDFDICREEQRLYPRPLILVLLRPSNCVFWNPPVCVIYPVFAGPGTAKVNLFLFLSLEVSGKGKQTLCVWRSNRGP